MAHAGGTKAYVHSLSEALHVELAPLGVHVTVLVPGPTDTQVLVDFFGSPAALPMKPMSVERSVAEALRALDENRARVVPGVLARAMHRFVPSSLVRRLTMQMFTRALGVRSTAENDLK
jgi:short-subunit dehydrogenase